MTGQIRDIMTVTLNPALDLSAEAPGVVPGQKLRLSEPVAEPGGGGVNVARAISLLGGSARAFVALGGTTGERLEALMRAAGLDVIRFDTTGETRQSLVVTDTCDMAQYRFILPGPAWSQDMVKGALEVLSGVVTRNAFVVLSGSQPPGVPQDFSLRLAAAIAPDGARLIVDTSGPALDELVRRPQAGIAPHVLRLDQAESEALAGGPLSDADASLDLAERLVQGGVADVVVLARGADGSVLAGAGQRLHCVPPHVVPVSRTGAGDSFTGAFVLALARGADLADALRFGTAAAAAAVMTEGTGLCRREDTERLAAECRMAVAQGVTRDAGASP